MTSSCAQTSICAQVQNLSLLFQLVWQFTCSFHKLPWVCEWARRYIGCTEGGNRSFFASIVVLGMPIFSTSYVLGRDKCRSALSACVITSPLYTCSLNILQIRIVLAKPVHRLWDPFLASWSSVHMSPLSNCWFRLSAQCYSSYALEHFTGHRVWTSCVDHMTCRSFRLHSWAH